MGNESKILELKYVKRIIMNGSEPIFINATNSKFSTKMRLCPFLCD